MTARPANIYSNFNPRSPQGSDKKARENTGFTQRISIHAPRRGATLKKISLFMVMLFQSTLPAGERHRYFSNYKKLYSNFNPRSPQGSDPRFYSRLNLPERFQSTLPAGERPHRPTVHTWYLKISIHAPRRGATAKTTKSLRKTCAGSRKC